MNGMVIPGTPIAVDFWKISKAPQVRLFFLTHLHADHMEGLTSSWRFPIYTSTTNAELLKLKFKFPKDVVKSMDVEETYQISLDTQDEHILSVTVLDANHIPGAVMFLFQGYFGNYLYCGDMRWYPELLENPVLRSIVELRELDCLFLDNTFSAPYCEFPSREEAKKQVFNIIDHSPDSEIKVGVRSLGKETLLEAVAYRYQERILVTPEKFEMLRVLKAPDVYTTDPKQSRIHAIPLPKITSRAHDTWNESTSTISIILTALYIGWPNGPYSVSASRGLYVVPYSDHSSYSELLEMVALLAPRQVVPIVTQWSKKGWWSEPTAPDQTVKGDMSVYDHLLTTPPPDFFVIPTAVEETMKTGSMFLHHPEIRHCRLRRGLMPRPRRAKTIALGVIFSSPEPRTVSPTNTASTSIDVGVPSASSTPTHTSYPWKLSEASLSPSKSSQIMSPKSCHGNWVLATPESPMNTSSTQTLPCRLCKHQSQRNEDVPSCRDSATQTLEFRKEYKRKRKEGEADHRSKVKKTRDQQAAATQQEADTRRLKAGKDDRVLQKLTHEALVAGRELIRELADECGKDGDFKLLKTTKSLCKGLKLTYLLLGTSNNKVCSTR